MQTALFFRFGSFSHTNEAVLRELRARMPTVTFDDIDLAQRIKPKIFKRLAALASSLACQGIAKGRHLYYKTPTAFDFLSAMARDIAQDARRGRDVRFTFQTQTMFAANVDGLPHYIYTDHSHLTNLYYPSFGMPDLLQPAWIEREKAAFRAADGVFVMSRHVERALLDLYHLKAQAIRLVGVGQNASDVGSDGPYGGAVTQPSTVLFVGVDWERKGGPALIAAFDQVVRTIPKARLVVVGCSPNVSRPYLDIMGKVPLARVPVFYQSSSLFCLPTQIEPFGIVAIEAMSQGLPVILPRLGAFPDFVRPGENGWLFEPGNVRDLANTIAQALGRGPELANIGREARKVTSDFYNWRMVAGRMADVIEADLAQPRPAA